MNASPRDAFDAGRGGDAAAWERDPLFDELRRAPQGPDLSGPVLDRVERKGFFASAKLRMWIAAGRVAALTLGLGVLGGMLLAKRYVPEGTLLPVRQQPATAALDQGCSRAAKSVERALLRRGQARPDWMLLRAGRSGPARAAGGDHPPCSTTPTQAMAAALWSGGQAAPSGSVVQFAGPGVIELWHAPASPAQATALVRWAQLLSGGADPAAERALVATTQPPSRR